MTQDTQSNGQDGDRIDSWKKIAAYLGKDIRTAIRWSKDEGMPVYRHAGSKRGAIYAYRSEIDEWIHSDRSEPPRSYQKSAFFWASAVFVFVLIVAAAILWLVPFDDEQSTSSAERPWVLITDFDNRSGEVRFNGMVETALRRELSNSRHVLVVAPESVRDILALMKLEPRVTIDTNLGREICLRYGRLCILLAGQIEKYDSSYLLSLEVVDPADGRSVASAGEKAAGESEVLPAIQLLGNWLREYLGEELAHINLENKQLEQVTTPSLRALELYSRGMQDMGLYKWAEAEVLFRRAVEEDPGFASANLLAYFALYNQRKGFEEEAQSFLESAMELSGSASEQERYFIEATYYDTFDKDHEKACGILKTLANLFPDHVWAANNASIGCGTKLGNREDLLQYVIQSADLRVDSIFGAATALTYLAGDFDRARLYVERLKGITADGGVPGWKSMSKPIVFTELFAAEEFLNKGMLPDVVSELQRIEPALGSMDSSLRRAMIRKLRDFYLALGQFQNAQALYTGEDSAETTYIAFLAGDQVTFNDAVEVFLAEFQKERPDPTERLVFLLKWNMRWWVDGFPLDVLVPLYDPDSAVVDASPAGEPPPEFISWPKFEAKLQLARGKQLLNQGQVDEAIPLLRTSVRWFRDRGGSEVFQMYFMGAEFLAVAYAEQDNLQAAYRVLEDAAEQRNLVHSFTAPLHQKIQARRALLARELGRTAEAESIEAELAKALLFADEDHPILIQIREQRDTPLEFE